MSVSIHHSAVNPSVEKKKSSQLTGWCCLCGSYSGSGLQQQWDPSYESAQALLSNSTKKMPQTDFKFLSCFFVSVSYQPGECWIWTTIRCVSMRVDEQVVNKICIAILPGRCQSYMLIIKYICKLQSQSVSSFQEESVRKMEVSRKAKAFKLSRGIIKWQTFKDCPPFL